MRGGVLPRREIRHEYQPQAGAACWRRSGPGSRPCIRGSRVTVAGLLGRVAKGPPLMLVTIAPAPERGETT